MDNSNNKAKEQFTKNPWSTNQAFRAPAEIKVSQLSEPTTLYIYSLNDNLKDLSRGREFNIKLVPQAVSEAYSAKYATQEPFGVMRPLNYYIGGTSKKISFGFDMHESDFTHVNLSGESIYLMVDQLKLFSEAYISKETNTITAPLVYLQLGTQFAGVGHIETSFEYKLPFVNGRYQHVVCSMEFTFHEEFEFPSVRLIDDRLDSSLETEFSSYSDVLEQAANISNINISNLIASGGEVYSYFITQVQSDEKLNQFIGTEQISLPANLSLSNNLYQALDKISAYKSDDYGYSYKSQLAYSSGSEFAKSAVDILYKQFVQIANPSFTIDTRLENFNQLRRTTVNAHSSIIFLMSIVFSIIQENQPSTKSRAEQIYEDLQIAEELLVNLINNIDGQIFLITNLRGAGE